MTKAQLEQLKSDLVQVNGMAEPRQSLTRRDVVSVFFRHRRLALWSFLGALIGASLVVGVFVANRYKTEMKILVGKERSDPVISAAHPNEQIQQLNGIVAESDVNTEVSLLQDDDLLRQVVLANNLQNEHMSLVGPRPLPLRDYAGFDQDWQRRRFSVLPGITCLWQVTGRSNIEFDRWMELDMQYIDDWSFWLDLKILLRTIPSVFKGVGAA